MDKAPPKKPAHVAAGRERHSIDAYLASIAKRIDQLTPLQREYLNAIARHANERADQT